MPAITRDLAATEAGVQLTLTGTLLGLGIGQLAIGPLSDALGRRRPLLAGAAVHAVASVSCAFAPTVEVLAGLRTVQGMASAAGFVVALALVRDLYVGRPAAVLFSRLFLVVGVSPIVAPVFGGALLSFTSWRGIFVALAIYAPDRPNTVQAGGAGGEQRLGRGDGDAVHGVPGPAEFTGDPATVALSIAKRRNT